jgi:DNA adenine methylase
MQLLLFDDMVEKKKVSPFQLQLLKWVGNKQRFAHEIASYFPAKYRKYFEPFLGSGAVLATLQPQVALASDIFLPLAQIWITLKNSPETLKEWYSTRYRMLEKEGKIAGYERIKESYNATQNPADLLFLCRSCYGGVVRFRKSDGYMSTPCGIHDPISPENFSRRVDIWYKRTLGTIFEHLDYQDAMKQAIEGDLIYCDPPYSDTQAILYGAQDFKLLKLFETISECKKRGVYVALSIDGKKQSGQKTCNLPIPAGLFEREVFVNSGPSMLKRFQMEGKSCKDYMVADRLLLTY